MSDVKVAAWPDIFVGERIAAEFDFAKALAYGDNVATLQLVPTVLAGVDPAPTGILYGSAVIKGGRVFQWIYGAVGGCSYRVECRATTVAGSVLILAGVLAVKAL